MTRTARDSRDLRSRSFLDSVALLSRRDITVISKPIEVKKFFGRAFVESPSLSVSVLQNETELAAKLTPVSGGDFVERLKLETSLALNPGPVTIVLRWLNSLYVFEANVLDAGSPRALALPERIYSVHRRSMDRISCDDAKITCSVKGPREGQSFQAVLLTASDRGLALKIDGETGNLPLLEEIEIEIGAVKLKAEVAHLTPSDDGASVVAGIRITRPEDPAAFTAWMGERLAGSFRSVRCARSDQDFEETADLITAMAGVARLPNREKLIASWKSFPSGPDRPDEIFLERRQNRPAATMAASRIYSKTFLLHTFAVEKRDAFHLPVEMFYKIRDFVLRQSGAEFVCGMWPTDHRFMVRYYTEFVRRDFDPADHHFEDVFITRFTTNGEKTAPLQDILTGSPTNEDEGIVWANLKERLSPVYFEASDFGKKDLNLDEIGGVYGRAGQIRRREIVVAKEREVVRAFAVAELCTGGAGFFGLSNSFRIFFTSDDPSNRAEIARALVGEVLARYRAHKIDSCCLYGEGPDEGLKTLPGYAGPLGRVSLWFVRQTRTKAFLRHLERVNWELSLFRGGKVRVRPSVLKAFDYQTEPFKPRKCMRLEDPAGIPGVTCGLKRGEQAVTAVSVVNLDTYGASVTVPPALRLQAGEEVELDLRLSGTTPISINAIVRHAEARVAPGFQADATVAGLEFLSAPMSFLEKIRDFVFDRLNPDIRLFAAEDFEPLGRLLDKAKYFDYFENTEHDKFIRDARPTYEDMEENYPNSARVTVLKAEDSVIGSHSFYRVTEKTWQLHQLAVDPDLALYRKRIPTKSILQSTFQYLCLDSAVEYMITYFNDDAAIARAYFEAGQVHYDARDFAFIPCRWTPVNLSSTNLPPSSDGLCGDPSEDETLAISGYLASIVPSIEYDALAFSDPTLKTFDVHYADRKLFPHERRAFVARDKHGKMRVFAIVNLAPRNLNFLGVLDNFRIFEVPWCNVATEASKLALVQHVFGYFRQQTRQNIFFEMDEKDSTNYSAMGVRSVGKSWRLIAHRRAFMTALQFFLARYGKLEERLVIQDRKGPA